MLLPTQAPPVMRERVCGDAARRDSEVRPQQPPTAHDFEISWGCKKIKLGGSQESVLAYHLQGAGGGWHVLPEYPCS